MKMKRRRFLAGWYAGQVAYHEELAKAGKLERRRINRDAQVISFPNRLNEESDEQTQA